MAVKELYLSGWDFNKCVLCDMLERYVLEQGGELKGLYHHGIIHRCNHNNGEIYGSQETNHCDTFGSYVQFVLNGEYFTVNFDDNPFFDMTLSRIQLDENGKYVGQYYSQVMGKQWLIDPLLSHSITDEEFNKAFEMLKHFVFNAPQSRRYIERRKTRVANRYDNRYHYEYVDVSDKTVKIPREREECNW